MDKKALIIVIVVCSVIAVTIILLALLFLFSIGVFSKDKKEDEAEWYSFKFKKPEEQFGNSGEKQVASGLKVIADTLGGYLYNSLCFVDDMGYSTEIDHVLVTRAGLFVVETKTMNGTITGSYSSENWTCVRTSKPYQKPFPNPIIQNQGHINHLRRMLKNPNIKIYSVVIFPISNISHINCDGVFTLKSAINYIKNIVMKSTNSDEYIQRLNKEIDYIISFCSISKEQHIQNINRIYDR